MSLREYQRKRRFDRTPEPPAARARPDGRGALFVVQLHHARRRHYDFRLQMGDALHSWAVPKGPSFDPSVKRLAVEVEDHPLDYAGFEGTIPPGEYGAGEVRLFDRGTWRTGDPVDEQLRKGHLRFELHGNRLRGGWSLIRTGRKVRQPEWLLVKSRDEYAADREADDLLDEPGSAPPPARPRPRPVERARAPRSRGGPGSGKKARGHHARRFAVQAARQEGARPETLDPTPFRPELARLVAAPPRGAGWLHEVKWDGYRLLTVISGGTVRVWSRNHLDWTARLPAIVTALEALPVRDARLDGELIAVVDGRSDFNALQAALADGRDGSLAYALFDILHVDGIGVDRCALADRKALLQDLMQALPAAAAHRLTFSTHHEGEGATVFRLAAAQGLEGIVSKRAGSPYRAGRGDDWQKVKTIRSDEFAVVGYTPPKGARSGIGALLLARADPAGGWRYAGRVGTGFSDAQLRELARTLAGEHSAEPPVDTDTLTARDRRGARWVKPRLAVEVAFRGLGKEGRLRHPVFRTVRVDKTAADLRREADAARSGRTATKAGRTGARRGRAGPARTGKHPPDPATGRAQISNPERLVFPDAGLRKQDVLDYYAAAQDWILPGIRDRPLSIIRCPSGIAGKCFFQKHLSPGFGAAVKSARIREENGKRADYLYVNDADGLFGLVQMNAIELHPWGATVQDPDRADRIVFDLDPAADVDWRRVTAAARRIRELLEELSLQCFLRASGGKGLHVVVPLAPACTWRAVKSFSKGFAEALAGSQPGEFTAVLTKSSRHGRIFIDYLRNGRGATSVASYSLRARPGAPVAVPLAWKELGRLRNAHPHDLRSTLRRLARLQSDPWEDLPRVRQDLSKLPRAR